MSMWDQDEAELSDWSDVPAQVDPGYNDPGTGWDDYSPPDDTPQPGVGYSEPSYSAPSYSAPSAPDSPQSQVGYSEPTYSVDHQKQQEAVYQAAAPQLGSSYSQAVAGDYDRYNTPSVETAYAPPDSTPVRDDWSREQAPSFSLDDLPPMEDISSTQWDGPSGDYGLQAWETQSGRPEVNEQLQAGYRMEPPDSAFPALPPSVEQLANDDRILAPYTPSVEDLTRSAHRWSVENTTPERDSWASEARGGVDPRDARSERASPEWTEADLTARAYSQAVNPQRPDFGFLGERQPTQPGFSLPGLPGEVSQRVVGAAGQAVDWARQANPAAQAAGDVAGMLGNVGRWTAQNLGDPIQGQVQRGLHGAVQAASQGLGRQPDGVAKDAFLDPNAQALLDRDPAAAARYLNERYSIPLATGVGQLLSDPTNWIGTRAVPNVLRGVEGAVAKVAPDIARGIGAAATKANQFEDLVDRPAQELLGGVRNVLGKAPGLGQSERSAALMDAARTEDSLRAAQRSGVDLGPFFDQSPVDLSVRELVHPTTGEVISRVQPQAPATRAAAESMPTPAPQQASPPVEVAAPVETGLPQGFPPGSREAPLRDVTNAPLAPGYQEGRLGGGSLEHLGPRPEGFSLEPREAPTVEPPAAQFETTAMSGGARGATAPPPEQLTSQPGPLVETPGRAVEEPATVEGLMAQGLSREQAEWAVEIEQQGLKELAAMRARGGGHLTQEDLAIEQARQEARAGTGPGIIQPERPFSAIPQPRQAPTDLPADPRSIPETLQRQAEMRGPLRQQEVSPYGGRPDRNQTYVNPQIAELHRGRAEALREFQELQQPKDSGPYASLVRDLQQQGHPRSEAEALAREAFEREQGLGPAGTVANQVQRANQAVVEHARQLTTEPAWQTLTPRQQEAVGRAAQAPAVQAAYKTASADLQRAQNLINNGRPDLAETLMRNYGVSDVREFNPASHALGKYYEQLSRGLEGGLPERSKGVWGMLDRVNEEWRAAVLMSPGRVVRDVLDFSVKSGLEGILPFTGSIGRLADHYGYASLSSFVRATQGAGVLRNEMLAAGKLNQRLGVKGMVKEMQELLGQAPGKLGQGNVVDATWGTSKGLMDAVVNMYDSNARHAAFFQVLDREMKRSLSDMVRSSTKDLGREVSNSLYQLERVTPAALAEHLQARGLRPELVQKYALNLNLAHERAAARAEKLVAKVHANYGDVSTLQSSDLVQRSLAFTRWATANLEYYAQAALSRPAMWAALAAYEKNAKENNQLGENQPKGLDRYIELSGGLGHVLGALAFGHPGTRIFANPVRDMLGVPGQRQGFTGEGASPVGTGLATISALTGINFLPYIDIPLKAAGIFGNVPINVPVGNRTVPGAVIQGAYGAATGGRNLDFDFSKTMRDQPLGGQSLNQRFADPHRAQTGAGPGMDAAVRERVAQNSLRAGISFRDNPAALEAANNPQHPLYQEALQQLLNERSNWQGQMVQGSTGVRGMSPEKYTGLQQQGQFQEDYQGGQGKYSFGEALARSPEAENFWSVNAPRELQQEMAAYARSGIQAPTNPDARAKPDFPGRGASPDDLAAYSSGATAVDLERAQFMGQARQNLEARQAGAPVPAGAVAGPTAFTPKTPEQRLAELDARDAKAAQSAVRQDFFGRVGEQATQTPEQKAYFDAAIKAVPGLLDVIRSGEPSPLRDRDVLDRLTQFNAQYDRGKQLNISNPGPHMVALEQQAIRESNQLHAEIRNTLFNQYSPAQRGELYRANPGLGELIASGAAPTREALAQAAKALGIAVPETWFQTMDPRMGARTSLATPSPVATGAPLPAARSGPPATPGGYPARGGYAPRSGGYAPRGGGGYAPRGGSAPRGGLSSEPFTGSTTNQQWGSAWGHVNRMKDDPALGPGAAAQYVYENFDRFKELADALGQPMRDKLSWGAAMNTLTERPGSIEGLNLRDGKEKLYEMQDVLKSSVEMARDNRLDINAFVQGWQQKFGEALAPTDVTLQKLEEKLVWAMSNIQQLGRYEKSAKGQAEVAAYQQHRQQLDGMRETAAQQRAQYDAARAELQPVYDQITQLRERSRQIAQQSPDKASDKTGYYSYWNSVGPEQDRLREEIKRLDELAKERQGRVEQLRNETRSAYDKYEAARSTTQLPSRAKDLDDDWFTK